MPDHHPFKAVIQSYVGRRMVTDMRSGKRFAATQMRLAEELGLTPETLSRKLTDPSRFTNDDIRRIGETLIWWGLITEGDDLRRLFAPVGYALPDEDWRREPWQRLHGGRQAQPRVLLPLENASFEVWDAGLPAAWRCNTKTGWIARVPGRADGSALEIGGNPDNLYWVYCRTRETQDIAVVPGSKIQLSFWARLTEEGKDPERARNVEVAFFIADTWQWAFALELTDQSMDDTWQHYSMEWWDIPLTVERIAVGVVVYRDGTFQVDDVTLHMRTTT